MSTTSNDEHWLKLITLCKIQWAYRMPMVHRKRDPCQHILLSRPGFTQKRACSHVRRTANGDHESLIHDIMCQVFDDLTEKRADEKVLDEKAKLVKNLVETMKLTAEQAMEAKKIPETDKEILATRF